MGRAGTTRPCRHRTGDARGHLCLRELLLHDGDGPAPAGDARAGAVLALTLAGHITLPVLDSHDRSTVAALAQVHVVEASAVVSLDEAGAALLVRVYLAAHGQGRRVLLPWPAPAVVTALARYGGPGLFDPAPRGADLSPLLTT